MSLENIRDITEKYSYMAEIVDSYFDGAMGLIENSPNTAIFGGFLRDVVANLPINGDLDILVKPVMPLIRKMATNSKWIPLKEKNTNDYKIVMGSVPISFINYNNKIVQFIPYEIVALNPLFTYIRTSVDFTCCGFCLTPAGEFFEVLPGAEQDCINKIVRLNKECNKKVSQKRIDKFVKAGWIIDTEVYNNVNTSTKIQNTKKLSVKRHSAPRVFTKNDLWEPSPIDFAIDENNTNITLCSGTNPCNIAEENYMVEASDDIISSIPKNKAYDDIINHIPHNNSNYTWCNESEESNNSVFFKPKKKSFRFAKDHYASFIESKTIDAINKIKMPTIRKLSEPIINYSFSETAPQEDTYQAFTEEEVNTLRDKIKRKFIINEEASNSHEENQTQSMDLDASHEENQTQIMDLNAQSLSEFNYKPWKDSFFKGATTIKWPTREEQLLKKNLS